jgi:hypothetical protein
MVALAARFVRADVNWRHAPVAQLDRAAASGAVGREFESLRARHLLPDPSATLGISARGSIVKPALSKRAKLRVRHVFVHAHSTIAPELRKLVTYDIKHSNN